jgi:transposase InsO family protein
MNIRKIKSGTGSQITSKTFREACSDTNIEVCIATPKYQEQNQTAEKTWNALHQISEAIPVHARLPTKLTYHVIKYAIEVMFVFHIQKLTITKDESTTPYLLLYGNCHMINHFRVFGCACRCC